MLRHRSSHVWAKYKSCTGTFYSDNKDLPWGWKSLKRIMEGAEEAKALAPVLSSSSVTRLDTDPKERITLYLFVWLWKLTKATVASVVNNGVWKYSLCPMKSHYLCILMHSSRSRVPTPAMGLCLTESPHPSSLCHIMLFCEVLQYGACRLWLRVSMLMCVWMRHTRRWLLMRWT